MNKRSDVEIIYVQAQFVARFYLNRSMTQATVSVKLVFPLVASKIVDHTAAYVSTVGVTMDDNHEPIDSFELNEDQGLLDEFEPKTPKGKQTRVHNFHWPQSLRFHSPHLGQSRQWFARAGVLLVIFTIALALFVVNENEQASQSEGKVENQLAIPLHPKHHSTRKPTTLIFSWNITTGLSSPDGVEKTVYLVNGMF